MASLLKRWLLGTHQGAVSREHLDYYLEIHTQVRPYVRPEVVANSSTALSGNLSRWHQAVTKRLSVVRNHNI